MRCLSVHFFSLLIFVSLGNSQPCLAQLGGGGQPGAGGGQQPGGGFGQGQGNFPGGIVISPDGVVAGMQPSVNPRLLRTRQQAFLQHDLPESVNSKSQLRVVSLNRLEAACVQLSKQQKPLPTEMQYFAGIHQLQYVFVCPETKDLLIAGPAEGFAPDASDRMRGVSSGRPPLVLQDLLTLLRLNDIRTQLGCSFDPNRNRMAQTQAWYRSNSGASSAAVARQRLVHAAGILGTWDVTVFGLPDDSHAALTAVEADYRLKRVALGLDRLRVRGLRSHLDLAGRNENIFRRWWFAPHYESIEKAADGLTYRFTGPRLQLLSQEELIDEFGNRSDAPFKQVSSERFTQQFNRQMDDICRQVPAFAAVQNLFDLAVLVALMQKEDLPGQVDWQPELFLDSDRLPLPKYSVPTSVPSEVNAKMLNRSLFVGLIGGGVVLRPQQVIARPVELQVDSPLRVDRIPTDAEKWWWDASPDEP